MSKQVKIIGEVTVTQSTKAVERAGFTDNAVSAKVDIHNKRVALCRDEVKNGTFRKIRGYDAHNTLIAGMAIHKKAKMGKEVNPVDRIVPMLSKCNAKQLEFIIKSAKALLNK